jgi:hypothetical protein
MRTWIRGWGTTLIAWVAVLVIGGVAVAGVSARSEHAKSGAASVNAEASGSPDVEASETPDAEGSGVNENDNHGACVSHWAHAGRDLFDGQDFGAFVSSVARSDGTGPDCATPSPEATTESGVSSHGKSGQPHGKSGDHKPADAGAPSGS